MTLSLQKKVNFAIKLLRSIPASENEPVEISYSGGKDSDVILELAKMAGINYRAIYKNTSIDPIGTIKHCKENGVEIIRPKRTFFQLVAHKGCPTRRCRFCCSELKEYKVLDRAVLGIRRSESTKREALYKEPEICRVYSKKSKVRIYLPILEWTDDDVAEFIKERGIKCHPLYYDKNGEFHVERRLGCIGCPLTSGNGKAGYKQYPKMLKLLIKNAQPWMNSHTHTNSYRKYQNAYNLVFSNLFCKTYDEYQLFIGGGIFGNETAVDPKKYMEDYFGIDLTI